MQRIEGLHLVELAGREEALAQRRHAEVDEGLPTGASAQPAARLRDCAHQARVSSGAIDAKVSCTLINLECLPEPPGLPISTRQRRPAGTMNVLRAESAQFLNVPTSGELLQETRKSAFASCQNRVNACSSIWIQSAGANSRPSEGGGGG